jgi:hypothetical protein
MLRWLIAAVNHAIDCVRGAFAVPYCRLWRNDSAANKLKENNRDLLRRNLIALPAALAIRMRATIGLGSRIAGFMGLRTMFHPPPMRSIRARQAILAQRLTLRLQSAKHFRSLHH